MQLGLEDIFVFPVGRVVTNSGWDEAGRAIGFYKNGDVLGGVADYTALTGGQQVTAADRFIFALRAERKKLETDPFWFGVARYTLDGKPAKWPGGEGRIGNVLLINPPKRNSRQWQSLTGSSRRDPAIPLQPGGKVRSSAAGEAHLDASHWLRGLRSKSGGGANWG